MGVIFTFLCLLFFEAGVSFAAESLGDTSLPKMDSPPPSSSSLVEALEDDEKRAQLIDNIKTLKNAKPVKDSSQNSSASTPFIADLNGRLIQYIEDSAKFIFNATHALAHFPPALFQTLQQAKKPDIQEILLDFALVFLFSIFSGYVTEWIIRIVFYRALRAPQPPISLKDFTLYFGMTLIPLLTFAITASFLAGILNKYYILPGVLTTIGLLFMVRLILKYFKLLLQPSRPTLRVMPMADKSARRLYRIVSIFGHILFLGTLFGQILMILGITHSQYEIWQNILGFVLLIVVGALVIDYRSAVATWIRKEEVKFTHTPRFFVGLMNVFSRIWHIGALSVLLTLYLAWIYHFLWEALDLLKGIVLSATLFILFRSAHHYLSKLGKRLRFSLEETSSQSTSPSSQKSSPLMGRSTLFLLPFAQVTLYIATFILALEIWGVDLLTLLNNPQIQKQLLKVLSIILVMVGVRVLWGFVDLITKSQLQTYTDGYSSFEPTLFTRTVAPILRSASKGIITILGALVILSELSVDIMPIIYAFSVISLAISFGAQTMVKDLITGFLYLFEGNIAVGESVKIGNYSGKVEAITLRSVFLRHSDGSIQSIPFSEVSHIINMSRDYTNQEIYAIVAPTTPIHIIYEVLDKTFEVLKGSQKWKSHIIKDLIISGLDMFGESYIRICASVMTKPDPKKNFLKEFNALLQENMTQAQILPPTQFQKTV